MAPRQALEINTVLDEITAGTTAADAGFRRIAKITADSRSLDDGTAAGAQQLAEVLRLCIQLYEYFASAWENKPNFGGNLVRLLGLLDQADADLSAQLSRLTTLYAKSDLPPGSIGILRELSRNGPQSNNTLGELFGPSWRSVAVALESMRLVEIDQISGKLQPTADGATMVARLNLA